MIFFCFLDTILGLSMADSFKSETSDLLCAESTNTCFNDLDCNANNDLRFSSPSVIDREDQVHSPVQSLNHNRSMSFVGLALQSEEIVSAMVGRETEYLPRDDYLNRLRSGVLDLSVRREAIDWIWKAHDHCGFGPLSICLCINYLDRFLSIYELPRGKTWAVQLLAVACMSIAAKMEETKVPQCVDLQVGDPKFVFEAKTIKRMELLVLSTLKWRMQALTPCSFIDYYLSKISNDKHTIMSSISRSMELVMNTMKGIHFLEFKPSEIAASVAVYVSGEVLAVNIDKTMSCFIHLDKGRVLKCIELIKDISLMGNRTTTTATNGASGSTTLSMPQSPVGVLDVACLSSKSDDLTVESYANSSHYNPLSKKRKKIDFL